MGNNNNKQKPEYKRNIYSIAGPKYIESKKLD